jgi:hypothetical protein
MSACSRGDAVPASALAFASAASAGALAAGSIGALMLGPSTRASPQKQMAQEGSISWARRKLLAASAWLKPKVSIIAWSM